MVNVDSENVAAVVEAQRNWLDKLQEAAPSHPIKIKAIEGGMPKRADPDLYKWVDYKTVFDKLSSPIYTRGILFNEILIDPDSENWTDVRDGVSKLHVFCKENNIPHTMGFSGGKGIHFSIIFGKFTNGDKESTKELFAYSEEYKVDAYKTVRRALLFEIAKRANVDLKKIGMDTKKINFRFTMLGSQVRDFGTIRGPGKYKTLITEIPAEKPEPYELPLVFPDQVETWNIQGTEYNDIAIEALEQEIDKAKNADEYTEISNDNFKDTPITKFPCIDKIFKVGIKTGRYYACAAVVLMCHKCGIPKDETEKCLKTLCKTFPRITQEETDTRINNSMAMYEEEYHFSCISIKETFQEYDLCNYLQCPIKEKIEEAKRNKENVPIEEITQEEINKIRADRYSPRIPNLHNVLDEHHLINVYCDWISSLSDTYYEYQVGSVFWLLSALTQGKVCLKAKQETIKPNLWSFFLGRSTTSRKSTAINKVKDIFTNATASELFNDEFSIEGYLKLLSKYPVNNIVRDEAGGLLAKSYKKYNDGIFDIECLVYDGQGVRKTLAKEEVTIINPFVTHLYGTTLDTFTSVMQLRTVLGGYGFRFLYFAPDYIKPRKDIDMETEEDIEKWAEILTRVKKLKKFFDNSDTINFKVEPDAFKNYNQVIANLETTIDNIGDSMLNSALGRYQVYILKLAMLIEIGKPEPSFTIYKNSMNLAISLVVDYFLPSYQDIVERLEEDIKFNQVEKVVSTLRKLGNTAPRHKLLKNSKIKQKDFDEVISTLVASKTLTIKTITGTGGSDGEVFILEDVKLNLRSVFSQRPSFPSFPSFTHVTNNYTNAVKEVKEAKTNIECASRLCFTSDMGERRERRERRETSKITVFEDPNIQVSKYTDTNKCMGINENLDLFRQSVGMRLDMPTSQSKIIQTHTDSRIKNDMCVSGNLDNLGISVNLDSSTEIKEVDQESKESTKVSEKSNLLTTAEDMAKAWEEEGL